MRYRELQPAIAPYRNALLLESLISGTRLRALEFFLRVAMGAVLFLWLFAFVVIRVQFLVDAAPEAVGIAEGLYPALLAFFHLALGLWLFALLLWSLYASSYFADADTVLYEPGMQKRPTIRFEVAEVLRRNSGDPVVDFFISRFGAATAFRLGLSSEEVRAFLGARATAQEAAEIELSPSPDAPLGLAALAEGLVKGDEPLRQFLAAHAIETADFAGAAAFVSRIEERYKNALRRWSRDALGRVPGFGKDWGYGETALLERYASEITGEAALTPLSEIFGKREADELERMLARGRETNVLLVGEEGVPKLAPVQLLARRIRAGTVLPPLEHKRIFVLNGALFVSAMKEKTALESELMRVLTEASKAGNIIFVFDRFDAMVAGARSLQSDILAVLDPFFVSSEIQIAGIAETGAFHQFLEPNGTVKERFERVFVEGAGAAASIPLLEDEAVLLEAREGVVFTFQSIRAVAESAERYFPEGVMPDKAIDLLSELPPKAHAAKKRLITKADVLELVSRKTGIAAGEVKGEERTKLLKLEEILHERIVGQEEAVRGISGALRRARSGIGNPERPLGSFLFLGPTGVGKTETTKALAQAFFGDEKQIIRFDMSEYREDDALARLIGSFESGKAGVLTSALRERPYGVLLLDEFEKTNKDIHDLFLQILDEGFFTDAAGKRVNARNLMIIATSNAGSDIIWQSLKEGKGLDKDVVMTEIINRGIFKPELLNRFDGVILFHPLGSEHLRTVARFQLQKLAHRLEEKGLELVIADSLLDYLVSVGQDPKFGARPMNRAIQEKVEQVIAEKMLRGEIAAGSRVELTGNDLR